MVTLIYKTNSGKCFRITFTDVAGSEGSGRSGLVKATDGLSGQITHEFNAFQHHFQNIYSAYKVLEWFKSRLVSPDTPTIMINCVDLGKDHQESILDFG